MATIEAIQTRSEYELERGKPMPSLNHAAVQLLLGSAFLHKYGASYTILSELTLDMAPPATPDISVYPKMSLDWLHDETRMAEPPLLVVEILSPSQSIDDLVPRIERYFEFGIKSCWLVQPTLKLIAVFAPEMEPHVYTEGEVEDPATDITVTINEIFKG